MASEKRTFRDLIVWQKSMALVANVYGVTRSFPKDEQYGLTSQIRRSAVSVPSNIAEGQARLSRNEFRVFLGHAKGSLAELETQLLISQTLGYVAAPESLLEQLAEVRRLLNGLLASLRRPEV